MENEEIAYQNKDITSKVLSENFKGKTFRVYGLELPEIVFLVSDYSKDEVEALRRKNAESKN